MITTHPSLIFLWAVKKNAVVWKKNHQALQIEEKTAK